MIEIIQSCLETFQSCLESFQSCLKTKKKCLNFCNSGIFLYLCRIIVLKTKTKNDDNETETIYHGGSADMRYSSMGGELHRHLRGRRIANGQKPKAKGLYINNGKMVVIK